MKYHIEKNSVQETLVIPLYGRKMCSELCTRRCIVTRAPRGLSSR